MSPDKMSIKTEIIKTREIVTSLFRTSKVKTGKLLRKGFNDRMCNAFRQCPPKDYFEISEQKWFQATAGKKKRVAK